MAEATEIPEAKDPFERQVAITIAIIAVVMSFVSMKGDNAKTDSILLTSKAANKWSHFQSKSIKQNIVDNEIRTIELFSSVAGDKAAEALKQAESLRGKVKVYDTEKAALEKEATALVEEADHASSINDRCDFGALFLQLGVVVASVAILTRWKAFWFGSILLGAVGAVIGLSSFAL